MGNSSYSGSIQPSRGSWWKDWTRAQSPQTMSQNGNTVKSTTDFFVPADYTGAYYRPAILWISSAYATAITGYIDSKTITIDNSATRSNVPFVIWAGAAGFQELDLDVAATLVRKGNDYIAFNGVPTAESLGGDTLPSSLYRTSKPSWFGDLTWPAFDPTSRNRRLDAIPAGYRFLNHGAEAPGVGSTQVGAAPTTVRIIRSLN
jgi:hypothetical protein